MILALADDKRLHEVKNELPRQRKLDPKSKAF